VYERTELEDHISILNDLIVRLSEVLPDDIDISTIKVKTRTLNETVVALYDAVKYIEYLNSNLTPHSKEPHMKEELPPLELSALNINEKMKERLKLEHELLPERLREYTDVVDGVCRFCELLEGLVNESDYDFLGRRMDFLHEEVLELSEGIAAKDDEAILDGAADVAFVAIGQMFHVLRKNGHNFYQAKTNVRSALMNVCDANLSKKLPKEKGAKIEKPVSFKAPDHSKLLHPAKKEEIY
jgi:hypothetical protein